MKNTTLSNLIGSTPMMRLRRLKKKGCAEILIKLEIFNPGGSVKDRIALEMISDAEQKRILKPGGTIIEPTSGNTGISLAMLCATKKYRLILVMPEDMSLERRTWLKAFGAEIILTPAHELMMGAINQVRQIKLKNPDFFMPEQFNNPSNPLIHKRTTAVEIEEATQGNFSVFVTGVGTGGTITGIGEYFKEKKYNIQIVAVEPEKSAVLSGKVPAVHNIQGIGAGFIPPILNRTILDRIITISDEEAYKTCQALAQKEGLLLGISSGANVAAALKISEQYGEDATIVTLGCDRGERYFSINKTFEKICLGES